MIQSYKQLITGSYAAGETKVLDVDQAVSFTPVTNAKITFFNASEETFHVKVWNHLYIMNPDNPLAIVDETFTIVDEDVTSATRLEVLLNGSIDNNLSLYIVQAQNTGLEEANFYYVIEGLIEPVVYTTIPNQEI